MLFLLKRNFKNNYFWVLIRKGEFWWKLTGKSSENKGFYFYETLVLGDYIVILCLVKNKKIKNKNIKNIHNQKCIELLVKKQFVVHSGTHWTK